MMRLPWFDYRAPRSVAEAAKILAGEGPAAMLIAGGTDLLPNMKRRHQTPAVLVSLRQIKELKKLGKNPRIGPETFPSVPYPKPIFVAPPWEGGDGKETKRDDAVAVV